MKVYIIHEDSHGVLGVADSYESAVQFLIDEEWMPKEFEIWDEKEFCYRTILINFEEIKTWRRDKFNDFFFGTFEIEETNLITNARNKIEEVLTNDGLDV